MRRLEQWDDESVRHSTSGQFAASTQMASHGATFAGPARRVGGEGDPWILRSNSAGRELARQLPARSRDAAAKPWTATPYQAMAIWYFWPSFLQCATPESNSSEKCLSLARCLGPDPAESSVSGGAGLGWTNKLGGGDRAQKEPKNAHRPSDRRTVHPSHQFRIHPNMSSHPVPIRWPAPKRRRGQRALPPTSSELGGAPNTQD
jgi:hypothetical protein